MLQEYLIKDLWQIVGDYLNTVDGHKLRATINIELKFNNKKPHL